VGYRIYVEKDVDSIKERPSTTGSSWMRRFRNLWNVDKTKEHPSITLAQAPQMLSQVSQPVSPLPKEYDENTNFLTICSDIVFNSRVLASNFQMLWQLAFSVRPVMSFRESGANNYRFRTNWHTLHEKFFLSDETFNEIIRVVVANPESFVSQWLVLSSVIEAYCSGSDAVDFICEEDFSRYNLEVHSNLMEIMDAQSQIETAEISIRHLFNSLSVFSDFRRGRFAAILGILLLIKDTDKVINTIHLMGEHFSRWLKERTMYRDEAMRELEFFLVFLTLMENKEIADLDYYMISELSSAGQEATAAYEKFLNDSIL